MKTKDRLEIVYMPLSEVNRLDGNPKLHDIGKIVDSIQHHGFKDPPKLEPALNDGGGGIVEGNGRTEALLWMKQQNRKVPRGIIEQDDEWLVPILVGVDSADEIQAKAYALDHNNLSLMGGTLTPLDVATMYDREAYLEMLIEANQHGEEVFSVDGDDLELLLSFDGNDEEDTSGDGEEPYSNKIVSPVYEPVGDKPELSELLDTATFDRLIAKINESTGIGEAEKEFLRIAATRHIIFDFEEIANYYAHSDAKIQELMEDSALVILDLSKAIELGYVRMSKAIKEIEKNAR